MKKRHKARKRGHAAKKKTAKKSVKAWPIKKTVANIEKRLAHVEDHLGAAGSGHARRGRARSKRR